MPLSKLLSLLILFSCAQPSKKEPKLPTAETQVVLLPLLPQSDKFTFTGGIRSLLHDRKGNYWLGSYNEGLCRFDGKTYSYFTTNEGLPANQVRSLHEDENGYIWIATANGVAGFDGKKIVNHSVGIDSMSPSKDKNPLWFTAGNLPGVYRTDGASLDFLTFPLPLFAEAGNSYAVTDITAGPDGKIWIATYTALFTYDGKSLSHFAKPETVLNANENLHIRSIFADSRGRVWIGNNGIGVLLLQGNIIQNFSAKQGLVHPDSRKNGSPSPAGTLEHVFAITEDSAGNIWFGDRDTGAWKYDGETMTNYPVDADLKTPMVHCIYEDREKNLLFGMAAGGVYEFDGEGFVRVF